MCFKTRRGSITFFEVGYMYFYLNRLFFYVQEKKNKVNKNTIIHITYFPILFSKFFIAKCEMPKNTISYYFFHLLGGNVVVILHFFPFFGYKCMNFSCSFFLFMYILTYVLKRCSL